MHTNKTPAKRLPIADPNDAGWLEEAADHWMRQRAEQAATLKKIIAYARARWCWDDEPFLEEAFGLWFGPADSVEAFVDELAADYDLIDPRDYA